MVKLADGEPVIVSAGIEDGFKITPRALEAAITEKTRLIFLNSPSNPTGAAYSKLEWQATRRSAAGSSKHRDRRR